MTIVRYILALITVGLLTACGGEESQTASPSPTVKTVSLKLSTSGTPSTKVAGISITVVLPDGVTPHLSNDGGVTEPIVSGVAAPGTVLTPIYTPASGAAKGTLKFALASSIVDGFGAGEYATVTLNVETGVNPALPDFELTGFIPIDVSGNEVTELITIVTGVIVP